MLSVFIVLANELERYTTYPKPSEATSEKATVLTCIVTTLKYVHVFSFQVQDCPHSIEVRLVTESQEGKELDNQKKQVLRLFKICLVTLDRNITIQEKPS